MTKRAGRLRMTRRQAGYTLVELLVVLAILGLLVGFGVPALYKRFSHAKEDAAKLQIETIASGLDLFLVDVGRYPSEQEGLKALLDAPVGIEKWKGPYLSRPGLLIDPWDRPYVYHAPAGPQQGYQLYTLGPDGNAPPPARTAAR